MQRAFRYLTVAALSGVLAPAWAGDEGPYAMVAAGRTQYDADCAFFGGCSGGRAGSFKVGGGYRFGVFALEVWGTDWGRSALYDYGGNDHLTLRSLGLTAAWRMHFGPAVEGVLRAGVAQVQQSRAKESFQHAEGTFGLGLSVNLTPQVALELAHDITTSTGGSNSIGSVVAQTVTGGVRLRF